MGKKKEGVWGKCAFCREKVKNAGGKNLFLAGPAAAAQTLHTGRQLGQEANEKKKLNLPARGTSKRENLAPARAGVKTQLIASVPPSLSSDSPSASFY